jgi:hypothetical protein
VIDFLIAANGRGIWDADDSVGWEDGQPRQTIRGYNVAGQLLVMIESDGGIDVLRSISPTNSLDDLGEAIARISRGEPPTIDLGRRLDGALQMLEDGEKVSALVSAAVALVSAAQRWPRSVAPDQVAGLLWHDHIEPLAEALKAIDLEAAAAAASGEDSDDA